MTEITSLMDLEVALGKDLLPLVSLEENGNRILVRQRKYLDRQTFMVLLDKVKGFGGRYLSYREGFEVPISRKGDRQEAPEQPPIPPIPEEEMMQLEAALDLTGREWELLTVRKSETGYLIVPVKAIDQSIEDRLLAKVNELGGKWTAEGYLIPLPSKPSLPDDEGLLEQPEAPTPPTTRAPMKAPVPRPIAKTGPLSGSPPTTPKQPVPGVAAQPPGEMPPSPPLPPREDTAKIPLKEEKKVGAAVACATAAEIGKLLVTSIALDDLVLGLWTPRLRFDPAYIRELADSLREEGQLKPIIVRPHPEKLDVYEVIDGEHRARAAKTLLWPVIRAEVRDMNDTEAAIMAMRVNQMHGKRLEGLEEAAHIKKLHDKQGLSLDDIASLLKRSKGWVAGRWSLATKLSPEAKAAVTRVTVTPRAAVSVATLPMEEQPSIIRKIEREELGMRDTENLVKLLKEAPGEEKQRIIETPFEEIKEELERREVAKQLGAEPRLVRSPSDFEEAVKEARSQPTEELFTCACGKTYRVDWVVCRIEPA